MKLNLKCALIAAMIPILFVVNCMKSYSQPTITLTASDGITLTWDDISESYDRYDEVGNPKIEDWVASFSYPEPHHAIINAATIQENLWLDNLNVISLSSSNLREIPSGVFVSVFNTGFNKEENNTMFTTVNFPNLVKVGNGALASNPKLNSVNLPNVKYLGEMAFNECVSLPSISLPYVDTIRAGAFHRCLSLIDVYIPSAKSIGMQAFYQCTSLNEIDCALVETIEDGAFGGCVFLENIRDEFAPVGSTPKYHFDLRWVKTIGDYAFMGCISLPDMHCSVEDIGDYSFSGCSGLTELALPKIKSIGANAFMGCPNIWKISFGKEHTKEQIITLSEQIFGNSGMRAGGNVSSADIEIELGENVLPKPQGNNWNGFTWKKVTVVPAVTGIEEINVSNILNIYPNPVTDLLHVDCRDVARNVSTVASAKYFIYNSVGQIVLKGKLHDEVTSLNVRFLPSGMYYLHVDGQTVKFLKR